MPTHGHMLRDYYNVVEKLEKIYKKKTAKYLPNSTYYNYIKKNHR